MTGTQIDTFDTNDNTLGKVSSLPGLGIKRVIRYINPLNIHADKTCSVAEAKAYAANGIRLGIVVEGWGDVNHGALNSTAGQRDALVALNYLFAKLGLQKNDKSVIVWFAVDTDLTDKQIQNYVIPYFTAIKKEFDHYDGAPSIGVYGSGAVCRVVVKAGLAGYGWGSNSNGWNGTREYKASNEWTYSQQLPKRIAGLDTDPDVLNPNAKTDGCFVPFQSLVTANVIYYANVSVNAFPVSNLVNVGPIVTTVVETPAKALWSPNGTMESNNAPIPVTYVNTQSSNTAAPWYTHIGQWIKKL